MKKENLTNTGGNFDQPNVNGELPLFLNKQIKKIKEIMKRPDFEYRSDGKNNGNWFSMVGQLTAYTDVLHRIKSGNYH